MDFPFLCWRDVYPDFTAKGPRHRLGNVHFRVLGISGFRSWDEWYIQYIGRVVVDMLVLEEFGILQEFPKTFILLKGASFLSFVL